MLSCSVVMLMWIVKRTTQQMPLQYPHHKCQNDTSLRQKGWSNFCMEKLINKWNALIIIVLKNHHLTKWLFSINVAFLLLVKFNYLFSDALHNKTWWLKHSYLLTEVRSSDAMLTEPQLINNHVLVITYIV